MNSFKKTSLLGLALLLAAATASAGQFGLEPVYDGLTLAGYGVGQSSVEGGFSVHNGQLHYWNAASGYHVLDAASDTITDMGWPDDVQTNFGGDPFGVYDPASQTFYAATFLNGGESRLYSYSYADDAWTGQGSAVNMYGGAVSGGRLYISGLREPWSGGFDTTYISLYDTSSEHRHDALIQAGGASAHVAVGGNGDVYYASYGDWGSAGSLYRWSADSVASCINDLSVEEDTFLTLDDAEVLSSLPAGGNGIAVDDDGVVFFTVNNFSDPTAAGVLYWSPEMGTGPGDHYGVLATAEAGSFGWFGPLAIEGSFFEGAELFTSSNFNGHFVGLTVPEPATALLMTLGLGALARRRKR